jgi:hypothetical protein
MTTPLAMINLALEGRIDFLRKTNPWGSAKDDEDDWKDQKPDPEGAARKLIDFVKARKAMQLPKKDRDG